MKMKGSILVLLLSVSAALGQENFTVVPGGLANVEGNSASGDIFNSTPSQLVQVFSAFDFGFPIGASGRVTSISFRIDGGSGQSFVGFRNIAVALSTTTRSPDSLSPVFNDN